MTSGISEDDAPGMLDLIEQHLGLLAQLPFVPTEFITALEDVSAPKTTYAPASELTVGSLSDSKVRMERSNSGEVLTLKFSYDGTPPSENVDFQFIIDGPAGQLPVSANLTFSLPTVADAAYTLRQSGGIYANLRIAGAETIEVVRAPANGTVTLSPQGELYYKPTGTFFGTDELVYRARNGSGVSRDATVIFEVERRFEGSWIGAFGSWTTSESRQDLCPYESGQFSFVLSKISEQEYRTTFNGQEFVFQMSGKNDPAGLRSTGVYTHPDGGGTSTEVYSFRIPDSDHFEGRSDWSFAQGGEGCSGYTLLSGNKQSDFITAD